MDILPTRISAVAVNGAVKGMNRHTVSTVSFWLSAAK